MSELWLRGQNFKKIGFQGQNLEFWLFLSRKSVKVMGKRSKFPKKSWFSSPNFGFQGQNFDFWLFWGKKVSELWLRGQNLKKIGFQGQNLDFWLFLSRKSVKVMVMRSKYF